MEKYAALLDERPDDIDFSLFDNDDCKKFVNYYYDKFGELPDKATFEQELEVKLPGEHAPWKFYEDKLKGQKFIRDAIPYLTQFNEMYNKDQEKAILSLRDKLMQLNEPDGALQPVSIVKNTDRYEHFKDQTNSRIPTGIKPLDDISGGLSKKDEFVIVSARLGIGKSWVAHYMATSMCEAGYKVGLYSGEMSEDEVGARFDALVSHISNFALTRGKEIDLTEHKEKLASMTGDFLILTAKHLRHNATPKDLRKFVKEQNLDCLFIDQLSLMEPDGDIRGEYYVKVARLSLQLKTLQQELRIPIVAVSQLNRGAVGQEPDASNLAGSDRIGQDATMILALGRKDDVLKIKVLKARSFRIPETAWEFTWDIDKGILEPRLSAMDGVRARVKQAAARQAVADAVESDVTLADNEVDDEIW